jgi:glycosyltransferase involved in cell wall biosynthesis
LPPNRKLLKTICHITFSEYPNDQRIRRYVNALIENGFRVAVICIRDEKNREDEYGEKIIIKRLKVNKKRGTYTSRVIEYAVFFAKSIFFSTKFYFKYKINVFHIHTFPDFAVFVPIIPKIFGAKIILDMHELTPEAMMIRENYSEKKMIIKSLMLVERASVWFADELITIHNIAGDILSRRNKRNFSYIVNGIDEKEFGGLKKEQNQYFDIVYHGTINPNLNLGVIIDALAVLKEKMKPDEFEKVRFLIYGKGPSLDELLDKAKKNGLEEKVIYKGIVSHEKMLQMLCRAAVTVYPPRRNIYTEICYPIKLTEFINLKIPIIATKYKTLNYFYPDDCLFYIDPENLQDIADKIIFVYRNPEAVKVTASNAFKAYRKVSWEKIMKQRYLDLIFKMTG